jgi:hypothetical protein
MQSSQTWLEITCQQWHDIFPNIFCTHRCRGPTVLYSLTKLKSHSAPLQHVISCCSRGKPLISLADASSSFLVCLHPFPHLCPLFWSLLGFTRVCLLSHHGERAYLTQLLAGGSPKPNLHLSKIVSPGTQEWAMVHTPGFYRCNPQVAKKLVLLFWQNTSQPTTSKKVLECQCKVCAMTTSSYPSVNFITASGKKEFVRQNGMGESWSEADNPSKVIGLVSNKQSMHILVSTSGISKKLTYVSVRRCCRTNSLSTKYPTTATLSV